jgi:hypothetical protein
MSNSNRFFKLLSVSAAAKTVKGEKQGYLTGILYMAPSDQSGVINVCPHASPGCRAACLFSAGMGRFPNVIQARTAKTVWFASDRAGFLAQLKNDITIFLAVAATRGMVPAIRLNGTSDLPYENFGIIQEFPKVQFYDYTKDAARFARYLNGKMPKNYHLTFSRSETNGEKAEAFIKAGGNVAVVFAGKTLPATYLGAEVISGDKNDLRFRDKKGVVVGLTAKGKAKKGDHNGFVVSVD